MAKSLVSAKNNMNIYRGCTHGCIYCDSRSEVYGKTYDFEDIEVKVNAPQLIEKELGRRRQPCMITTGAMTDPYLPLEKELENTKKCLEVIEKYGFGVAVLTKSDLILRDTELLQRINRKARCVVQMTMTTFDERLCSLIEPNVAGTRRRFEVLKELQKAGIPTIVWFTPMLPFINDTPENVQGILEYCGDAGVKGVLSFGAGMTLRYGNREYYYKKLDEHFPGLKKEYMKKYGSAYGISSPSSAKISRMIKDFCDKNGMMYTQKQIFGYVQQFELPYGQMSMFGQ